MTDAVTAQSHVQFDARAEIEDALYRFAAGQDLKDRALLESAFARDAVLDFVQPASRLGLYLEPFVGRSAILDAVWGATAELVTTHSVTNVRVIECESDAARVTAMIEAQHLPKDGDSRNLLLKNMLDVELVRAQDRWLITRMIFRNMWKEGDPKVLFPRHD
jgi:SnoaL-like domain